MPVSTITSKGQTTIPAAVHNFLGLHAGDSVEFVMCDEGEVILKAAKISVRDLAGMLPKPECAATLEKIQDAIESDARETHEGH